MTNSKNIKKRNWTAVLYPESMPKNWIEILHETGLPCAVSPLHNKDLNADGEPKKPHYHIIMCYSGPTSFNVVSRLTNQKLCGTIPQPVEQIRGMFRYFSHKDNPEKAQYDENEIRTFNGFNILDFCELTRKEIDDITNRILLLIREKQILEYADLLLYLLDNEMREELEIAKNHTILFNSFIRSMRHKQGTIMTIIEIDFADFSVYKNREIIKTINKDFAYLIQDYARDNCDPNARNSLIMRNGSSFMAEYHLPQDITNEIIIKIKNY